MLRCAQKYYEMLRIVMESELSVDVTQKCVHLRLAGEKITQSKQIIQLKFM